MSKEIPPEVLLGELTLKIDRHKRYQSPTVATQLLYMARHKLDKMTDKHYAKLKKLCDQKEKQDGK